jgi:hypothetical protein
VLPWEGKRGRDDAGNDPKCADSAKHEAYPEHDCEIDCASLDHLQGLFTAVLLLQSLLQP